MPKKKAPKKRPAPKKIPPAERPLTEKQEAWCQWMASALVNFNGTEAARRAGYKGADAALARIAWENRRKPNVAARLEALKAKALSGANITVEKVLRDLEVARAQSLEGGQFAAAVRCSELQGKYLKMFTERIEHVQGLDEITDEQLAGLIGELATSGGAETVRMVKELLAAFDVDLSTAAAGDAAEGGALPVPPGAPTTH